MMNEDKYNDLLKLKEMNFSTGSEVYFYQQKHQDFHDMIFELAKFFLNERLGGCPSCYVDAYVRLAKFDLDRAKEKCDLLFRLAESQMIYIDGNPITNVNLTNEKAIEYLKAHPNEGYRFDILPDNLSDLLSEPLKEENDITAQDEEEKPLETEIIKAPAKRGRPCKRIGKKNNK